MNGNKSRGTLACEASDDFSATRKKRAKKKNTERATSVRGNDNRSLDDVTRRGYQGVREPAL